MSAVDREHFEEMSSRELEERRAYYEGEAKNGFLNKSGRSRAQELADMLDGILRERAYGKVLSNPKIVKTAQPSVECASIPGPYKMGPSDETLRELHNHSNKQADPCQKCPAPHCTDSPEDAKKCPLYQDLQVAARARQIEDGEYTKIISTFKSLGLWSDAYATEVTRKKLEALRLAAHPLQEEEKKE